MAGKRYYVVYRGRIPGVYSDWASCQSQVNGYPGNAYRRFNSLCDAIDSYGEYVIGNVGLHMGNPQPFNESPPEGNTRHHVSTDMTTPIEQRKQSPCREDSTVLDAFVVGFVLGAHASTSLRPGNAS